MELLLSFITMSLIGILLWLFMLIIRPITQKLFSQTWHYYVGLIPLFFLLGGSSIITPVVSAVSTALQSRLVSTIPENFSPIIVTEQAAENTAFFNVFINNVADKLNLNTIASYTSMLWAIGLLVFFAIKLKSYYQFRRKIFRLSIVVDIKQCPVKVIKSPVATMPMLLGVTKPVIVLPELELSDKELDIVLSHELIHQKRGDLIIKLIILIANGIHWFNPVVYYLNKDMDSLCELSCDEKLVCDLDKEGRKFYGETIISMLEYGVVQKAGLYTNFCNSKKGIKRRLLNMMNFKKTKTLLTMLSLAFAFIVAGFGGTMAFAMSSTIKDAKTPWYEMYIPMMAAEQIYVNNELVDGFPAFYTNSTTGDIFEENIYLPLKAVAEKLGLEVKWNSKTSTVTVGGIQVRENEMPKGYTGLAPQIIGGNFYIAPNFFTEVIGKDVKLTYKGVVTESAIRYETIQLGSQVYDIDLEEELEIGEKWECLVDEKTDIIFKEEFLGSEEGATDKKAIHRFTFKFPRAYAPKADEVILTFEQTLEGKKTGNKIIYTAAQQTAESVVKP